MDFTIDHHLCFYLSMPGEQISFELHFIFAAAVNEIKAEQKHFCCQTIFLLQFSLCLIDKLCWNSHKLYKYALFLYYLLKNIRGKRPVNIYKSPFDLTKNVLRIVFSSLFCSKCT